MWMRSADYEADDVRIPGAAVLAALALAVLTLAPAVAHAQAGGRGYLFGAPRGSFTIRAGYDGAIANSDLFTFVTHELTLQKRDFAAPVLSTEFAFPLNSRVDASVSLGYARAVAPSEFRDWLDNDNLPIQQQTEFTRVPLAVNLKAYLEPRGRAIGRYAWVPTRVAPYIGAGLGTMWYRFRQSGDFVDFDTNDIFTDTYESSAWTPMANVMTGADITVTPAVALNIEARYAWAQGPVGRDFSGFHRIDLSGVSLTAGVTFRY
jgi:outer membrane protein W